MKTPNKQQSAAVEPAKAVGAESAVISDSVGAPAVSENDEVDAASCVSANCDSGVYAAGSELPDDEAASDETETSAACEAEQSVASEASESAAAHTVGSGSADNSPSATDAETSERLEAIRAEAYARGRNDALEEVRQQRVSYYNNLREAGARAGGKMPDTRPDVQFLASPRQGFWE